LSAQPGEKVVPNQYLVRFVPGTSSGQAITILLPSSAWRQLTTEMGLVEIADPAALDAIANDPLVQYIEPNRIRYLSMDAVNDPGLTFQWALPAMHAAEAWQLVPGHFFTASTPEAGRIKVAILDTGVDCTHPDFMNAGSTSTDSARGGQLSFTLSRALIPTKISPATCPWQDDHGHGTGTASILAAAAQNGVGTAGLGFPVDLIVYKITASDGLAYDSTLATAIQSATDAGSRIISVSFAGPGYSQSIQSAINYAWQHDVLVVAAAGNSGVGTPYFPADSNFAVGVASSEPSNGISTFSNYGYQVDLTAPGSGIYASVPSYDVGFGYLNYGFWTGTSMSAPFVAAAAGLIGTANPGVPAAVMLERLQQSAMSNAANGGWDQSGGYGIINAYNAVSGTLRASSVGGLDGQVKSSNDMPLAGALIAINGTTYAGDSYGRYRVPNLSPGTYTFTVSAPSYPSQALTATIVAGADTILPVVLGANYAQFSGTVTDGSSAQVAGAVVQALSGGLIQATAFTDVNGQYSLWVPNPGTYDIRAAAIGSVTNLVPSQTVAAAGNTHVNVSVTRLGSVSGVVRDAANNPVPNAQLILSSGTFSIGAVTDASGRYTTLGVSAGVYSLTASATGQPDTTVPGVVVGSGVGMVNVQMGSGAPNPISVAVSPSSTTIQAAQAAQFTAAVSFSANQSVTWSLSPQIGSITPAGLYIAPASVSSSTVVRVTATSVADSTKSAAGWVTIVPAPTPVTVSLTPVAIALNAGNTQQFTAAVTGTSNTTVTWSMSPQVGQLSSPGLYSAPANISSAQAVVITATSVADPGKCATAVVNLQPTPAVVRVSVTPPSATLTTSQTQQFSAVVTGTSNTAVNWSVSPQIGQLSSAGLYTAPSTIVSAQTVNITVASVADPSKSATAVINLRPTVQQAVCPGPATGAFTGCYYNNTDLAGNPVLVRTDNQINFSWGGGAPAAGVTAMNFSARWQGAFQFAPGDYVFTISTSDGMRFYVDGNAIRSAWRNQVASTYVVPQTLSQGTHVLTLEYYESSGNATAFLSWQSTNPVPSPGAPPTISTFSAAPSTLTAGHASTLSWSVNGANSLTIDNGVGDVSALTSTVVIPQQTTTYTLTASNAAGSTTAHINITVTSAPDTLPPTTPMNLSAVARSAAEVDLNWTTSTDNTGVAGYQIFRNGFILGSVAGTFVTYIDPTVSPSTTYTYAVRAYDAAGNYSPLSASALVVTPPASSVLSCPPPSFGAFTGCYYNNTDLAGVPALIRTDNQINFAWGSGSPSNALTPMNFSVRWQGSFTFDQGNYAFTILASDGMRFYIDGKPIRSAWRDQSASMYLVQQALGQGNHVITLEYYEATGNATAFMSWQKN
jgi:Subtilase family/PA14 domain/Carboxypeptidase regulatory-like domain